MTPKVWLSAGHLSYLAWFISIELELLLDSSQLGNAERALAALPCAKEGEILQEGVSQFCFLMSPQCKSWCWHMVVANKVFLENENGHLSPGVKVNYLPQLANQEAPKIHVQGSKVCVMPGCVRLINVS